MHITPTQVGFYLFRCNPVIPIPSLQPRDLELHNGRRSHSGFRILCPGVLASLRPSVLSVRTFIVCLTAFMLSLLLKLLKTSLFFASFAGLLLPGFYLDNIVDETVFIYLSSVLFAAQTSTVEVQLFSLSSSTESFVFFRCGSCLAAFRCSGFSDELQRFMVVVKPAKSSSYR